MYHPVKPKITCFLAPGAYILAPYFAFVELSSSFFLHLCFCTLCLLHPAHLLGFRSGVTSSIMPCLTPLSSCLEQLFLMSSLKELHKVQGPSLICTWSQHLPFDQVLGRWSRIFMAWMKKCCSGNISILIQMTSEPLFFAPCSDFKEWIITFRQVFSYLYFFNQLPKDIVLFASSKINCGVLKHINVTDAHSLTTDCLVLK